MRWWDVGQVHDVEARAFPKTAWSAETFWSELAGVPATRHYVVAETNGQIVGFAGLMAIGADADVQTLAVDAVGQRQGVGRRLLDALLGEADLRGCTRVTLEVAATSEAAQRLYLRRGFAVIARRSSYYGPGADALIMRIRLRPDSEPEG
ncbi:MAG: ribosomal protein S18-alanine N-acetyltransferase [Actinomycetia bacterium]|nr:ribosomal protein S18-alanine N-acetyltransferase [Actinomycetes bacterium]